MTNPFHSPLTACVAGWLHRRLSPDALDFFHAASAEISGGASARRRAQLFALASRHARSSAALALDAGELRALHAAGCVCFPTRWSELDALRIALLLASPDLLDASFALAYEHAFCFADHGEACALYRALPLLPDGGRFVARAGEGCRSNMRTVFEAVACDSPYPATHFDDVSWRQLVIKAVFIDVPLWRIVGLDARLSADLARMALDLVDERRSAGRSVPPQIWLCLGPHAGERGLEALHEEALLGSVEGQRGALLGLGRAGALSDNANWLAGLFEKHAHFLSEARARGFTQDALQLLH
ncbi:EboA domain-containing protein [Paraburkholderia pallida]|uniref:Uncharacterized protein n=1 Tax=Paraburkholderia pallida TaxID=2547399 RepID=A0A4P7CWH3_9BURK|nr:EboA domain-containing protein [Paraburkholderia pallida]QBQ99136.1 hypothetical protein E1956_18120 [Paraburkholderia pallida]